MGAGGIEPPHRLDRCATRRAPALNPIVIFRYRFSVNGSSAPSGLIIPRRATPLIVEPPTHHIPLSSPIRIYVRLAWAPASAAAPVHDLQFGRTPVQTFTRGNSSPPHTSFLSSASLALLVGLRGPLFIVPAPVCDLSSVSLHPSVVPLSEIPSGIPARWDCLEHPQLRAFYWASPPVFPFSSVGTPNRLFDIGLCAGYRGL